MTTNIIIIIIIIIIIMIIIIMIIMIMIILIIIPKNWKVYKGSSLLFCILNLPHFFGGESNLPSSKPSRPSWPGRGRCEARRVSSANPARSPLDTHTVDGRNPAPVEVGSWSQYLWCRISAINSTIHGTTGCCIYIYIFIILFCFFAPSKNHLRQHNGRWQIGSLRQRHLMGEMYWVGNSKVRGGNSKVGVGYFTGKWPGKHRNSCSNWSICLTGGSPEKSLSPSFTNQILCMDFVVEICVCVFLKLVLATSLHQFAILKNGLWLWGTIFPTRVVWSETLRDYDFWRNMSIDSAKFNIHPMPWTVEPKVRFWWVLVVSSINKEVTLDLWE